MVDCKRVECGDCLPDFRYFVNQQPAIVNDQQTITPECPIGYTCQPGDPIIIFEGTKRVIPDVDPNDPDIDPNCNYACEANEVPFNPWQDLQPTIRVWNDEQRVTCQDIDPESTGTAEVVIPKNTYVRLCPSLDQVGVFRAALNQSTFDKAKEQLQAKIDSGEVNCYGWEATYDSDGCVTRGGRIVGEPVAFDFTELEWNYSVTVNDGEYCGGLGYVRVDQTMFKEFGPFATDQNFLIESTGTWFKDSPFFANAILRICAKTPAEVGPTAPPQSSIVLCSGILYPGTTLLSWGGAEPAYQTTAGVLPAGDTLFVLVGIFLYGQIPGGGPYFASGTNTGLITFTPVP